MNTKNCVSSAELKLMKKSGGLAAALILAAALLGGCAASGAATPSPAPASPSPSESTSPSPSAEPSPSESGAASGSEPERGPVVYENTKYGFDFYLPESWTGYSVLEQSWKGTILDNASAPEETGPELLIRHPNWTSADPRQDIPIMIFTKDQWDLVEKEEMAVSAAPIGPSKLGENDTYVFALPARYNFAFPTGYEEVETILEGSPLQPVQPG